MKYGKLLALLAVGAATLVAFAATASATVTSPKGTAYNGEIHTTSTNTVIKGPIEMTCSHSTMVFHKSKGATSSTVTEHTFSGCHNDTIIVGKGGTLSVTSSGTVTSTGAEITVLTHRTILGFPVTTHCIYTTSNTDVGTLKEGSSPEINMSSAELPQTATDSACGNGAVWIGDYKVISPSFLEVD